MQSLFLTFDEEFRAHAGRACPSPRGLVLPKIVDWDEETGRFTYDERHARKRPDWTYARRGRPIGGQEVGSMSDSAVGAQGAIIVSPRPKPSLYTLHTDGGIVAAPGQAAGVAAIGAVLKNSDNRLVEAISEFIGHVDDHHIAEFRALVEGLTMAERHKVDKIRVFTDSELLVKSVHDSPRIRLRGCTRERAEHSPNEGAAIADRWDADFDFPIIEKAIERGLHPLDRERLTLRLISASPRSPGPPRREESCLAVL